MKRIKWGNILKLVAALPCMGLILHDLFVVFISGQAIGWSWFGLATFIIALWLPIKLFCKESSF